MDANGKVSGTVREGATATEQNFLDATNDNSVIVQVNATSSNTLEYSLLD